MNLYSYLDYENDSSFRKLPCALFFIMLTSFSSFWSLLMVGCSNDSTFSFSPFIFSMIQLFMTCLWCNLYCSVASHVQKYAGGGGGGGRYRGYEYYNEAGDDDYARIDA